MILTAAEKRNRTAPAYSTVMTYGRRYGKLVYGRLETKLGRAARTSSTCSSTIWEYIDMFVFGGQENRKNGTPRSLGVRRNSFQKLLRQLADLFALAAWRARRQNIRFRWKISFVVGQSKTQRERAWAQLLDPAPRLLAFASCSTTVTPPVTWQMAHAWATRCRQRTLIFRVRF